MPKRTMIEEPVRQPVRRGRTREQEDYEKAMDELISIIEERNNLKEKIDDYTEKYNKGMEKMKSYKKPVTEEEHKRSEKWGKLFTGAFKDLQGLIVNLHEIDQRIKKLEAYLFPIPM